MTPQEILRLINRRAEPTRTSLVWWERRRRARGIYPLVSRQTFDPPRTGNARPVWRLLESSPLRPFSLLVNSHGEKAMTPQNVATGQSHEGSVLSHSTSIVILIGSLVLQACQESHDPTGANQGSHARLVRFTPRRPVIDRIVIQGQQSGQGGCTFSHPITLRKGQAVLESVLEYDLDSCRFIIARHPVEEMQLQKAPPAQTRVRSTDNGFVATSGDYDSTFTTQEVGTMPGGASPSSAEAPCDEVGDAFQPVQEIWYEDPVGIDVTTSRQRDLFFSIGSVCSM